MNHSFSPFLFRVSLLLFTLQRADAYWLRDNNIMDYSLLLGISTSTQNYPTNLTADANSNKTTTATSSPAAMDKDEQNKQAGEDQNQSAPRPLITIWEKDGGGLRARTPAGGPRVETYFMGVIDILQEYDVKKKLEHEYKARKQVGSLEVACVNCEFLPDLSRSLFRFLFLFFLFSFFLLLLL